MDKNIWQLPKEEQFQNTIEGYRLIKVLGNGSLGTVYLGQGNDMEPKQIALKMINKQQFKLKDNSWQNLERQITVMKECSHQNIVQYIKHCFHHQDILVFMEFCNGGNLNELLEERGDRISEPEAIKFLIDIIKGLSYLHNKEILHRDLKTSNIILSQGVCKLSGFWFAKKIQQKEVGNHIGNWTAQPPEVLEGGEYTVAGEIWSLGVLFYEIMFGKLPFEGWNPSQFLNSIKKKKQPDFEDVHLSAHAKDFLLRCFHLNPKKRLTWKEIYNHPLVRDFFAVRPNQKQQ